MWRLSLACSHRVFGAGEIEERHVLSAGYPAFSTLTMVRVPAYSEEPDLSGPEQPDPGLRGETLSASGPNLTERGVDVSGRVGETSSALRFHVPSQLNSMLPRVQSTIFAVVTPTSPGPTSEHRGPRAAVSSPPQHARLLLENLEPWVDWLAGQYTLDHRIIPMLGNTGKSSKISPPPYTPPGKTPTPRPPR